MLARFFPILRVVPKRLALAVTARRRVRTVANQRISRSAVISVCVRSAPDHSLVAQLLPISVSYRYRGTHRFLLCDLFWFKTTLNENLE